MPCTPVTLPGGMRAMIGLLQDADAGLSRWLASRACAICWRAHARMVCLQRRCATCATQVGPDTHLCPEHSQGPAQQAMEF